MATSPWDPDYAPGGSLSTTPHRQVQEQFVNGMGTIANLAAQTATAPVKVIEPALRVVDSAIGAGVGLGADALKRGAYSLAGYAPRNPNQYGDEALSRLERNAAAAGQAGMAVPNAVGGLYKGMIASQSDAVPAARPAPTVSVSPSAVRAGMGPSPDAVILPPAGGAAPGGVGARGGEDAAVGRPYGAPTAPVGPSGGSRDYSRAALGLPDLPQAGANPLPAGVSVFNPMPSSGTAGPGGVTDAERMNAPWAAANREFDDRKMAEQLVKAQISDYNMRMQQAQTARMAPRGGDPLATRKFNDGTVVLGGEDAVKARNAANPLPAPLEAGALYRNVQAGLLDAGARENRKALTGPEASERTARAGLLGAEAAATTERAKGYSLDREGKILDNQNKAIDLKLLGQKFEAGKADLRQKEIASSLLEQLGQAKDPEEAMRIARALTVMHGKDPQEWDFKTLKGGQEPIDPNNPGMGSRQVPEQGILVHRYTGEVRPIEYGPKTGAMPARDQARAEARTAIAKGAPRDAVNERLRAAGIEPI